MITNNDIRILVNTISNKEREGFIAFDKFNTLLNVESLNYFDLNLRMYRYDWKSRKTLEPFLVEEESLDLSDSIVRSSFSDIAKIIDSRTEDDKPIEIIENMGAWYDRLDSVIKAPTKDNPIMRLDSNSLYLEPSSITSLKDIIYIKYPKAPYLDGYLDQYNKFHYLEEEESKDLDGCTDCVTLDGTDSGTYDSKTVEMEFYDEDKLEIASRMLAALGITYDKGSLAQYMNIANE